MHDWILNMRVHHRFPEGKRNTTLNERCAVSAGSNSKGNPPWSPWRSATKDMRHRPLLTVTVDEETWTYVTEAAKAQGIAKGRVVDAAVALLRTKKDNGSSTP